MKIPLADKSKVEFNPNVGMKVRFIDKESGLDIGFSDLVEDGYLRDSGNPNILWF
jgi:hypothetical protein